MKISVAEGPFYDFFALYLTKNDDENSIRNAVRIFTVRID